MNTSFKTFFTILAFVSVAQHKHLFQFKHTLSVLGRMAFVLVVLLYAVGFGMALRLAERFGTTPDVILHALNSIVAVLTLTKSFFPSFQPASQTIAAYHPVSRLQRALLGIAVDLLAIFPVMIALLYAIVVVVAFPVLTVAQMIGAGMTLWATLMLDRSLRLLVEYAIRLRWLFLALVVVLAAVLVGRIALPVQGVLPVLAVQALVVVASSSIHLFLAVHAANPQTEQRLRAYSSTYFATRFATQRHAHHILPAWLYQCKTLFGTRHFRTMLLTACGIKIALMMTFMLMDTSRFAVGWAKFHINMEWMFFAPLGWFSYALNNTFGMNWQLWQTTEQHSTRRHLRLPPALRLYGNTALSILLLDAALTAATLTYTRLWNISIVVCWLASAVSLLALGAIVSSVQAIKVEKLTSSAFMSLREVTSTSGRWGIVAVVFLIAALSFVQVWYALAVPLVLVAIATVLFQRYATLKHRLYHAIHHQ
jgi:hypothetical protein